MGSQRPSENNPIIDRMKIAYIVLAHRYPHQLVRLIRRLNAPDVIFLIHLDSKMDPDAYNEVVQALASFTNVEYLARLHGFWGGWPIVQVTINALQEIVRRKLPSDYVVLLSGQCYPLQPHCAIVQTLAAGNGKTFMSHCPLPIADWPNSGMDRIEKWHFSYRGRSIVFPERRAFQHPILKPFLNTVWSMLVTLFPVKRRFPTGFVAYGGAQWWCMAREAVEYVCRFIEENPGFVRFFKYTLLPDEIFFQTILLNSPLRDSVLNNDLRHIDWSKPTRPAILGVDDLEALLNSPHLFARKFDATVDAQVLDLLDQRIELDLLDQRIVKAAVHCRETVPSNAA
jgi:hypothetical protein